MTSEHVGGDSTFNLLQTSLQCAVPLWIFRLKEKSWDTIMARREYLVDMIASHGDNILFRSKKAGETAEGQVPWMFPVHISAPKPRMELSAARVDFGDEKSS